MYKIAAMVGGGFGVIAGILSLIPLIGCLNCILIFVPGALAVILAKLGGNDIKMATGAAGGAVAGVCMTIFSFIISIPVSLLFSVGHLQQIHQQTDPEVASNNVMFAVVIVVIIGVSAIISASINAITGLIASAILNR